MCEAPDGPSMTLQPSRSTANPEMLKNYKILFALLASTTTFASAEPSPPRGAPAMEWETLPSLPDPLGYAGSFAGVGRGALLVAGGANFPDRPPWEAGTKTWTDRVFLLAEPAGRWVELEGKLPRPLGYGVSATTGDGLLCAGGSDARRHSGEW